MRFTVCFLAALGLVAGGLLLWLVVCAGKTTADVIMGDRRREGPAEATPAVRPAAARPAPPRKAFRAPRENAGSPSPTPRPRSSPEVLESPRPPRPVRSAPAVPSAEVVLEHGPAMFLLDALPQAMRRGDLQAWALTSGAQLVLVRTERSGGQETVTDAQLPNESGRLVRLRGEEGSARLRAWLEVNRPPHRIWLRWLVADDYFSERVHRTLWDASASDGWQAWVVLGERTSEELLRAHRRLAPAQAATTTHLGFTQTTGGWELRVARVDVREGPTVSKKKEDCHEE